MRYLSVCAGIEAATQGWHHMGWQPVAFSEIEPFPCAVLKHHYPNVPNWGDMTNYKNWPDANIDLLVGGTPCQSFSIAGLRKGLDDPRGNLMLTYLAIAERYRPKWILWENVPGVLSSNEGRDFGTFLQALGQLRYGYSYRVLDAQYFGVAQRRRRVFVVGHLGSWQQHGSTLHEVDRRTNRSSEQDPMSLRTELQQAVTQRDRAVRNGYSQRQDHSRLRVALIRAQQFLNSYPVAKDDRVAQWCKQHEDDVRIIVMGNHNERLKKLLQ